MDTQRRLLSHPCTTSGTPTNDQKQKQKTFVCLLHRCDFQAAVIKLAQEFWCGQEPSPVLIPNFVVISGHVVECASSKVSSKVREDAMITTIDDKDIVKEDDSTNDTTAVVVTIVCDSLKTDREDGAKQSQEDEEEVRDNRNCALFQSVRTHEGWLAILNGCDVCLAGYDILLSVSRWSRLFTMIDRLEFVVFPIFRSYTGQRFIARFSFYTSPNRVQSVLKSEAYARRPCFKSNSGQVQKVRQ